MIDAQETPGFDPFLNKVRGAETRVDEAGVLRGLRALTGRQVMVAAGDRGVGLAQLEAGVVLRFRGPHGLTSGTEIALSDHLGFRYVGVRARVAAAVDPASDTARLDYPTSAVFYPGRRHVRISGERIPATIQLELESGQRLAARAFDVSASGIGVVLSHGRGFLVGETFGVQVRFEDAVLDLAARVRSTSLSGDEVRLGLEFAGPADELARRVNRALETDGAD